MMIVPVTMFWMKFASPSWVHPVWMTVMRSAPTIVPAIEPSPPESAAPPITRCACWPTT